MSDVAELIEAASMLAAARQRADLTGRLQATAARLADDRVRVLVIGEFKQGKSQLVNALVRAKVCPVDDDIATSVPTAVSYADSPTVTLVKHSGRDFDHDDPDAPAPAHSERTEVSLDELAAHVAHVGNPENREGLSQVEVGLPSAFLQGGLELVDTPGVGGLGSVRATATLAALPGADAVLLISDAAQEYTAAEIEFAKHAVRLCPNLTCVVTKIDLYPEWRRIHALNVEHLARAGIKAEVVPVSSTLRWLALEHDDNDLNVESGFPQLATLLTEIVADAEALTGRVVANSVLRVTEQLSAGLNAELGAAENPKTVEAITRDLRESRSRVAALRDRSARWQQTLADGVNDLTADIDYDLRDRMREILRSAEDEIELLGDPAVVWVEFAPWVEEQVASAASANFVWAHERAQWLAGQVADHFAEDGQLSLPDLAPSTGSAMLAEIRPMTLDDSEPTLGEKALTAVRGGYIGTLMFGMFSTVAGLALLNPFSVGAGLLLGGRSLREEKKRQLTRRQAQAKLAVRQYAEDVIFHVGKDSRDMLRRVQRELRDHFTGVATELDLALQASVRTAEDAAHASSADRDALVRKLRAQAEAIAGVEAAARRLSNVPAAVG
ncbi:MAG TPA: dynamin family protein [Sporichthyaceae bacterium]